MPQPKRWIEEVIHALNDLGGEGSLSMIYEQVSKRNVMQLHTNWHSTVRRTIEEHSSDTNTFRSRKASEEDNVFYAPKGLRKGYWALRENYRTVLKDTTNTKQDKNQQEDKHLTRTDVENLLHTVGSPYKLDLSGQNLTEIDLSYLFLPEINLAGANLTGAILTRATLSRAVLTNSNLTDATLTYTTLTDANLTGADLTSANLTRAILFGTTLTKANLTSANLTGADLTSANLTGADLNYAQLILTSLNYAKLTGADLGEAILSETNLTGVDFTGVDLTGAIITDTVGFNAQRIDIQENISSFSIRIIEEPLTPYNLNSILSSITELSTKCWLIGKARFADLIEYTQTHDVRFVKETQLAFTKISYNSPFDATIKISATDIAQAIGTTIDDFTQAKARLEKAELENKALAQTIEHSKQKIDQENKAALLEQEKQELAIERERLGVLEKRLDVQKKGIEYALEIASKTVKMLQPNADEQTKAMAIQTLLPTLLQMNNGKGLELVLPAPHLQNSEEKK